MRNDFGPKSSDGKGTAQLVQDSNNWKSMQRREILTAWAMLSAPITGFVAYLVVYLGLQIGQSNAPLVAAICVAVISLFFLSWAFISHTHADWRKTTRFIAFGLMLEGAALIMTRISGHGVSIYFGFGSIAVGLGLLFGAKKY